MPASFPEELALSVLTDHPAARRIYEAVLYEISKFGPVDTVPGESAIELVAREPFAAVRPVDEGLMVVFYSDGIHQSDRIGRVQHVHNAVHHEVMLTSLEAVDAEVIAWLHGAYNSIGRRLR